MKNMFFLFTALLGLSLTNAVVAEDFYVGFEAGPNWLNSSNHHWKDNNNGNSVTRQHHSVDVDFDTGYVVGGLVGYRWCNNISAEVEFAFRNNKVDKVKFKHKKHNDCDTVCDKSNNHHKDKKHHSSHGELKNYAIMFNGRYDVAIDCCFTPYVKAGIGYANSKLHHNKDHNDVVVDNCDVKQKHHNKHDKNGFAWQVGVGVSYPICDNTTLDIGYNFLRAEKELNNSSLIFAAKYGF